MLRYIHTSLVTLLVGLLGFALPVAAQYGSPAINILERPTIDEAGDGFVTLTWEEIPSAVEEGALVPSYKVFYSTSPFTGTEETYVEFFGTNTGKVEGLTNNRLHYFTIVAVDTDGSESPEFSPAVTATPVGPDNGNTETTTEEEVLRSAATVALVRADAVATNEIRLIFNSNIVLPTQNPEAAFTVYEKGNPNALLTVNTASVDTMNKRLVVLATAAMKEDTTYLIIAGVNVANEEGAFVRSGVIDRAEFTVRVQAAAQPVTDTTTTEEVPATTDPVNTETTTTEPSTTVEETSILRLLEIRNLNATIKMVAERAVVLLEWALPTEADTATEQRVYQSTDGVLFSQIGTLNQNATTYEVSELEEGIRYWFRVNRANSTEESEGVLSRVVQLPASGPGALIFLGSALGAVSYLRRRQF